MANLPFRKALSAPGLLDTTRQCFDQIEDSDANFELEVNVLEYWEIQPSGKTKHFSWVTDTPGQSLYDGSTMTHNRSVFASFSDYLAVQHISFFI